MMKKKSKKLLLWLFVLTFVLTGIAGCGTRQKDDQEAASTETAGAISGVDDIVGKKIGVQLGTTGDIYVSDYENDGSGTTVERYNKGADAVQALKQGKIDCVVIDEQPALAFVEENPGLKILDEEFTLEEYAIVIAKGNDDLLEKVNTALEELRSEGTLDRITKNYIGTDAEKGNYPYEPQDVSRGNGTLTMGTNAEFPPYEYYENNEIVGIDVDIMQAIADKLGMELKIEDMAFDSIIPAVSTGKIDVGAAGFTVTEERKKNVNFTDTYATSKQVIIVRDGNAVTAKSSFGEKFYQNFIQDNRYAYMLKGLGNTLIITIFAVMIGIVLGFLIAIVRTSHDRNGGLGILNAVCKAYLTIIRGTPVMIQLLIIYYVIFQSINTGKIVVAVIGPGGKIIQGMQEETGAVITIEEIDGMGRIEVSGTNKKCIDDAMRMIKAIVAVPEVGEVYKGKVRSIMPYGAFVEFLPGKDGLLHISEIDWKRLETVEEAGIKEGDEIDVKLIDIDPKTGKFKLSRKVLLPRPEKK